MNPHTLLVNQQRSGREESRKIQHQSNIYSGGHNVDKVPGGILQTGQDKELGEPFLCHCLQTGPSQKRLALTEAPQLPLGCSSELVLQRQLWMIVWASQKLAVDWVRVTHMMCKAKTQINTKRKQNKT